jgi:ABC-type lipoprotein export system ATPase subunit
VSEISTGQRAALALSLFISLNRKLTKGPDIIIFDDPIAHIDDMNVLSFLDFLRFFILKENKQIFFATANDRLASLIEKKFAFLESDFVKIDLHRD